MLVEMIKIIFGRRIGFFWQTLTINCIVQPGMRETLLWVLLQTQRATILMNYFPVRLLFTRIRQSCVGQAFNYFFANSALITLRAPPALNHPICCWL